MKGVSIVLIAHILSGCVIRFGPLDEDGDGTSVNDERPTLPTPKPPGGGTPAPSEEEPVLDDAAQARQAEVDEYIRDTIYDGATIVDSFMLPSGDVVDFLDRNTLPAVPYEPPVLPFSQADLTLPPGVELGKSELEQIPQLLALAETATPMHRPTFWPYVLGETDATSLQDYLDRHQLGGEPGGSEHLHAGISVDVPNRGVGGFVNQFRPEVQPGSFSLIEFAVGCPAKGIPQEMVGVAISIDKVNGFGKNNTTLTDNHARLHVEYAITNPSTGKLEYTWDHKDGKFKPNKLPHLHYPGEKVDVSEIGGKQVEHLLAIYQDLMGNWWIAYQGHILGHYPADLFKSLNSQACRADWYGEVARFKPKAPTPWPATEMGSGKFPNINDLSNTAYVRNPAFVESFGLVAPAYSMVLDSLTEQASCYNHSEPQDGTLLGDRLLYLGGQGGKAQGCVWP
ncbi:neprosin family prolyl endopeptidase [Polyangium spumosum]|uniref:neprosin family prolyl endopeptidase n=1 Tax=Polyangium spumosum TaxID=889282 RepID=UPI0014784C87|nr:neprosin family prolyl endopeptidase [Polyangium spumosum]